MTAQRGKQTDLQGTQRHRKKPTLQKSLFATAQPHMIGHREDQHERITAAYQKLGICTIFERWNSIKHFY